MEFKPVGAVYNRWLFSQNASLAIELGEGDRTVDHVRIPREFLRKGEEGVREAIAMHIKTRKKLYFA